MKTLLALTGTLLAFPGALLLHADADGSGGAVRRRGEPVGPVAALGDRLDRQREAGRGGRAAGLIPEPC